MSTDAHTETAKGSELSPPVHFEEFVGRRAELAFLSERFAQARNGQGCMALLAGELGIGKTRLITEFRKSLGATQCWLAVGTCIEFIQPPYLPFRQIWDHLFGSEADPMLRNPLAVGPPEADDLPGSGAAESHQKLQTFMFVAQRLRELSKVRPLVIIVEDIHWADNATQDLLEYLVGVLPRSRTLLIVTYRSEAVPQQLWLESLVGRLERRHAFRLQLGALPQSDIRRLVLKVLTSRADVPKESVEQIIELAEGNPLFLEELLRTVLDTSADQADLGDATSASLRGAILLRVNHLNKGQQRLITLAAVFGRSFEPAFVARLASVTVDHVLDTLRRARQLQIIRQDPTNPQRYEFRHALTRHILYSELLPAQTLSLHAKIAMEMETQPEEYPIELAFHWAAAGNAEKAIRFNEAAGDLAAQIFAYRDAARLYRRALDFQTEPGDARAALCFKLANSLSSGGLPESANPWYEEALQRYEATNDIENQVIILLILSRQYWVAAQTEAALPFIRHAIKLADTLPNSTLQFDSRVKMANFFCLFGKYEEAEKFLKAAESLEAGVYSSTYHNCLGITLAHRGKPALAFWQFRKAIRAAHKLDEVYLETIAWNDSGTIATALGRMRLAVRLRQRGLALSHKRGMLWRSAYLSLRLAHTLLLQGELQAAKDLVLQSIENGSESAGVRILQVAVGIPLALTLEDNDLLVHCEDAEALELALRTRETDRVGPAAAAFIELYVSRGQLQDAKSLLRQSLDALNTANQAWDLLLWCATIGDDVDKARARDLLEKESEIEGHALAQGYLQLFDAVAAHRERRHSVAAKFARAAEIIFQTVGLPVQRARALELCDRQAEALTLYRAIGSVKDEKRLSQSQGQQRRGRAGTELTRREHDIALLVAAGLTNRMIGQKLNISENTVEHHLDSMFNRLGIRSRARLAALISEQRRD